MLAFTLLVFGLAWTVNATPVGNHTCTGVVKHPVTVRVNVTEPVTFRSYTWCLRVPPRCSQYTIQLKDRIKIHTEMHNRTITVCCAGYVEIDSLCVPACPPQTECPYMHCNRTNHCYCTPGYTGLYCSQPCPKGVWGAACQKPCDCPSGYTCHHLTGDCMIDDTPSTKPKRTTVVTYPVDQSTLLTTFSTKSVSTAASVATTTPFAPTTTPVSSTTVLLTTSYTPPIRLTTLAPSSSRSAVITSTSTTTSSRSPSTAPITTSSPVATTVTSTSASTSLSTPLTVVFNTTLPPTSQEPSTKISATSSPSPGTFIPSTVYTTLPTIISFVSGKMETISSSSVSVVHKDKSETSPDSHFFTTPIYSGVTSPESQRTSTESTTSQAPLTIPSTLRTPPTTTLVLTTNVETPASILNDTTSTVGANFTPSTTPQAQDSISLSPPPVISSTSPTVTNRHSTEEMQATSAVPFRMKITSPTPNLSKMRSETTVTRLVPKSPPNMHIISKTSDGRFILTNVIEKSSTRNTTKKVPSSTNAPSTIVNLPIFIPSTSPTSAIRTMIVPVAENERVITSTLANTLRPHILKRTKSIEEIVGLTTETLLKPEIPTSPTPKSIISTTVKPTSQSPANTLMSSSIIPTIETEPNAPQPTIITHYRTSSSVPEIQTATATRTQTQINETTAAPTKTTKMESMTEPSSMISADALDTIKTYLPKFNLDKDDSLELTKTQQKPTKLREKVQKKYKSKLDPSSTLPTSLPSSRKELDENLTNSVLLETTEFKVHLAATKSGKNTDVPMRKATTKLDNSEENSDSTRQSKKKFRDKVAKVMEETSSRLPITLFVSPSTGANAAHTWYSHMREKARAKSSARQQKITTSIQPTETSPMPEESNDIDSLAAMHTAAQDSKNGNSLQDEFNHPHLTNFKFNHSMTFVAGVQAARSGSFDFYSSVTALIVGCLAVLACLVVVTLLLLRLRNRGRQPNEGSVVTDGDAACPYETVYPVHELPVPLESVTFFCPTFTNNYAESMKKGAPEFNYDQPKSHIPEPLYAEIRH